MANATVILIGLLLMIVGALYLLPMFGIELLPITLPTFGIETLYLGGGLLGLGLILLIIGIKMY